MTAAAAAARTHDVGTALLRLRGPEGDASARHWARQVLLAAGWRAVA